jgi:hypothetical protein
VICLSKRKPLIPPPSEGPFGDLARQVYGSNKRSQGKKTVIIQKTEIYKEDT